MAGWLAVVGRLWLGELAGEAAGETAACHDSRTLLKMASKHPLGKPSYGKITIFSFVRPCHKFSLKNRHLTTEIKLREYTRNTSLEKSYPTN